MRISKWYLAVCAAAFCAGFMTVRADDTPAQAAARAALEEKLRELDTQSPPTNVQTPAPARPEQPAPPAAAATASPTPPPMEKPATTAASSVAPAPATAPAAPTVSNSDNRLFRPVPPPSGSSPAGAAPEENAPPATTSATATTSPTPPPVVVTPTVQQPTSQPAAATTLPSTPPPMEKPTMTAAPGVAPAQTTEPATPTASSSDHSLFRPVPPPSGGTPSGTTFGENAPSATTSAVQAPAPAPVQSVPMRPSQNDPAFYPGKGLGLQPIAAPPLPISADQQARLRALLEKYDAGTITPVQYQAEREKILAESH